MRRKNLEKVLRHHGWWFLRHGGKHDVWTDGEGIEAIPRHAEIHERLARAILKRVERES